MYDYCEYKRIGHHILNGILSRKGLRFTRERREEIVHDAAVVLFERIQKTGKEAQSVWACMRQEIKHILWYTPTIRREQSECAILESMEYQEAEKEDMRGCFDEMLQESPKAILEIHRAKSKKAMYTRLKETHGAKWVYTNASKIAYIYEVLRWTEKR